MISIKRARRRASRIAALTTFALVFAAAQSAAQTDTTADLVCSPSLGCLAGKVSARVGVQLGASTTNASVPQSVLLLPGTYTPASVSLSNGSLLAPFLANSSGTATSHTGFRLSSASNSVSVEQSSGLLLYSSTLFSGTSSLFSSNASIAGSSFSFTPLSLLVAQNVYAVATVPVAGGGSQRIVLREAGPDLTEWPLQLASGKWIINDVQGTGCAPACASGGSCSNEGRCVCKEGFTGATCNACAFGRFGTNCQPCPSCPNGTCEQGIIGTGRCFANANQPAAQACNCENGVCSTGNGQCTCNPGWADATGGKRCSTCAPGFYRSGSDCLACGPGCTTCAANTGTCQTCQAGLQVSADNAQVCVTARFLPSNTTTFKSCAEGTFRSGDDCTACSSSCKSCFGAASNQCTSCQDGRGVLNGACVSIDAGTGICDGTSINNVAPLAFVFDNQKQTCDVLPAGCTAASINSFSRASRRQDLECLQCLGGLVRHNGMCLSSCPAGTFADNGACTACSPGCSSCAGTASFCTSCVPGQLAVAGSCLAASTCPAGYFSANSTGATCSPCHPDCATCSGSFDQCTSCKASRPVLTTSKVCVQTCAAGQYLDAQSGNCRQCDSSCSSCVAAGSSQCLACPANSILQGGACRPAGCDTVPGLGVCVSALVDTQSKTQLGDTARKSVRAWVIAVIVIGSLVLIGMIILLWRMRSIHKRQKKTEGFERKRGFFGLFRRSANDASDEKDEGHDSRENIELVRTPTPPTYSYATQYDRKWVTTASSSYSGSDSKSQVSSTSSASAGRGRYNQAQGSFYWPPAAPSVGPRYEFQSNNPFSKQMRKSASSVDSSRRYGSTVLREELEQNAERQKALETLTRPDSRW